MIFKQFIKKLYSSLALALPEDIGKCAQLFANDGNTKITLCEEGEYLMFKVVLGDVPVECEEKKRVYGQLLERSGVAAYSQGASVCVDLEHQKLLLYRMLPIQTLSYVEFQRALEGFLDCVDYYNKAV